MIINLIYIALIIVAIIFALEAFVYSKKWELFFVLLIFGVSLWLEARWMNEAYYMLDVDDFLRTSRDIIRTLIMVFCINSIREHGKNRKKLDNQEKN